MRFELKRVEPLRAANISALIYALLMAAFAVLFAPFLLLGFWLAPGGEYNPMGLGAGVFLLFAYPVMGLVMGWVSGLLSSSAFNLIVGFTGGLVFHLDGQALDQRATAPVDRVE
jgi:hypothetical protein